MKIRIQDIVLGTHYWKDCNIQGVSFLKNEHHHDFWIRVECEVKHDDRDVEFITLRVWLKKYMKENYDCINEIFRFYNKSCEMLSQEIKQNLVKEFGEKNWKVNVSEDNIYTGGEW